MSINLDAIRERLKNTPAVHLPMTRSEIHELLAEVERLRGVLRGLRDAAQSHLMAPTKESEDILRQTLNKSTKDL